MSYHDFSVQDALKTMPLSRCGPEGKAGLWAASLPWPNQEATGLQFGTRTTSSIPLGHWPGDLLRPRRLLLFADGENESPPCLFLRNQSKAAALPPAAPEVDMELMARETEPFIRERHWLRIGHQGKEIRLAMGLRRGGKVQWWEACGLTTLHQSEACQTMEMGGAIEVRGIAAEESNGYRGYKHPFLHVHNWLNGRIYMRIHANGVCEIFAHHINSRFVDYGADFEDVVPVIGFHLQGGETDAEKLIGPWDGTIHEFTLGGVHFDVSEVARLARPEQPGLMEWRDETLVWQPYLGAELYGGDCPEDRVGDPFIFHAEKKIFPQGMARTLRFSLSLSDRSPQVVRYQAPPEWYEQCGEFSPGAQIIEEGDDSLHVAREWTRKHVVQGGFEDGSLPRHLKTGRPAKGRLRHEPGWEGELPYGQFLTAWQTGDPEDYAIALRAAYFFTDVIVDHSAKLVRMHGYAPPAVSLPMCRMQGTIAAYLETGDPYLWETAEAVTANAYWLHRNSWPRLAVGRDACHLRSAVMLYRYGGEHFFRRIAWEGALNVAETQRENGSFGDQGGGTGIHQAPGYISKPWMGLLAVNGLLDYLELFPHEEILKQTVKKFADWLMVERQAREGALTWCYQHDFDGQRRYYDRFLGQWTELPSQDTSWHHETLARLMKYVSAESGDPAYQSAWLESHKSAATYTVDHSVSAAMQFLREQKSTAEPSACGC